MSRPVRLLVCALLFIVPVTGWCAEQEAWREPVDTAWVVITAALVFLMQAGFAFLESGMAPAKNTVMAAWFSGLSVSGLCLALTRVVGSALTTSCQMISASGIIRSYCSR